MAARVKEREKIEVGPTVECLCGCGTVILQFDQVGRERQFVSGHNIRSLWREVKALRREKATPPP